ncbi:ingle-stranded DNA-binding replication protein A [Pseudoloma neurophilia]|uniref:Replication protein A subunit n=1 Tax=Pseudoloma neurophilia TaxID=146866 RepID=A0A0R0LZL5_9MICR|nr:ingle-stranded DNA-binding replication protein A [Pseudoloma neurophilia]
MLRAGTIETLYANNRDSPLYNLPILQLLSIKRIGGKNENQSRLHVTVSDGKFYMKGICSTQLSSEVEGYGVNSILKIADFIILEKSNASFIYIKACEKLRSAERIGTPKNITDEKDSFGDQELPKENVPADNFKDTRHPAQENVAKRPNTGNPATNHELHNEDKTFTPIAALNPFQNKWFIKGTVQKKSDMRDFKKKDGKFFTFELLDKSGSIKLVAFNEAAHLFFEHVIDGTVLEVSKATVKMTNKQFNSTTSDYEIHLEKNSYCNSINEKPIEVQYNFTKIYEIPAQIDKAKCTTIGIVHEAYPVQTVIAKTSQKELKKRDVILIDETGQIRTTLWGDQTTLELEDHPVLLISDAKISEFNGQVTLSTSFSSTVKIDPEINESFSIKGWYDANKGSITVQRPVKKVEYQFLEEVQQYGTCIATLLFIKEDSLFYNACTDGCNKKVTLTDEGYHCERCNQTKETCDIRYLTTFHISDFTQQVWLQVFDDFCTSLFGMSADDLKKMGEENSQQLQAFLKSLLYKEYVFKVKRSEDVYKGEMKIRWRGISIQKINYDEECNRMMKLLKIE